MVVKCEIKFENNPAGTYFNGQLAIGTITLNVDKATDVKAITLKLEGLSLTKWKERKFQRRQLFFGREDYLASTSYLLGSEESFRSTIQTGIHTYNFSCQIPHNCPSSFEGRFGYIRYMVKVVLLRPWKTSFCFARGFTVLKMLDLNFDTPALRIPSTSETYKTFCCGPCTTEPIKLELNIPQTGYVPGQNIPVHVLVINNSNLPVAEVRFSLVMLIRYFSQRPTRQSRVERIVVSQIKGESVLRNCTRSIAQQLHVSATPPTCLSLCKLIQIAYQVEVEARMHSVHGSQVITMPVVIGNVPLRTVILQQPTASSGRMTEENGRMESEEWKGEQPTKANIELPIMAAVTGAALSITAATDTNIPPPSYEESVHMVRADIIEDEQHDFGPCEFVPLYPVFDIPSPTAPIVDSENGFYGGGYVNQNFES